MNNLIHGILSQAGTQTFAIKVKYANSPTLTTDTPTEKEHFDSLVMTDRASPVEFSITLRHYIVISGGSSEGKVQYRKNSGSWVQLVSVTSSSEANVSIPLVDYDDTIEVQLYANCSGMGESSSVRADITGGTITGGGIGTVSNDTPYTWTVAAAS